MKLIRWLLLLLLVLGWIIVGSLPPHELGETSLQAMPVSQVPNTPPAETSSALKFDLQKLSQTLDDKDIAAAIQQVELGWKKQFEDYYQGQLTSRLLSATQIGYSLQRIARLTGKKTALVYAISTPDHLELMLVLPTGKLSHQRVTAANRKLLTKTIKSFQLGITNASSQPSTYLPVAQQLYQWIIAPLQPQLKAQQIDTLLFCLGGGLRSLPLAALHDGDHFLIEKYSLAIIPAFNLLDQNSARLAGEKVLAMGASQFQNQSPLPAVPTELATINKLWRGESWLNQNFTLANLKARRSAASFGIIHLATHAKLSPGSVNTSYIQFWNSRLYLNDLPDLGLGFPILQLLVLSACQTALGDPNAELGFAGLAIQSGAKATIASLWSISDIGTLDLMIDFYQQLKSAPIKAEALRQTQVAMIRRHLLSQSNTATPEPKTSIKIDLSHPYYWAAFTVIGNPW